MPARLRLLLLAAVPAILCLGTFTATPAGAVTGYTRDVYFWSGFERQVDNRTCTAASVAMMMNFITRRDLDLPQMTILRYEQTRDALNDSVQRGSDPLGWARAATYFSRYTAHPTTYHWEAYPTRASALARAAKQLATTGKPIGLLVSHGGHAVVMTGLTASANPAIGPFTVGSIAISDPIGSAHAWVAATSAPLNTYTQLDATATYDSAWYGKYVIIVPQT